EHFQPTYTVELLFGSTAMESVEPIRSCPRVGAFDQGMEMFLTTRRPGNLSDGSFNAWKGLAPVAAVSSRTTTTSVVATVPLNLRQPKKAAYTVPPPATAGRTDGPSCPSDFRVSIGQDLYDALPS